VTSKIGKYELLRKVATGGSGSGTSQSYFGGVRSSWLFIAISQVMAWPVYAAIRPMMASSVLLAMYSPLLIGLPLRMLANSSLCSVWYISPLSPVKDQSPESFLMTSPLFFSLMWATPWLPATWADMSLTHPCCWRQLLKNLAPSAYS
jgi:hypothetical protein